VQLSACQGSLPDKQREKQEPSIAELGFLTCLQNFNTWTQKVGLGEQTGRSIPVYSINLHKITFVVFLVCFGFFL